MGNKHAVVSITDTTETGKAYSILREVYVDGTHVAAFVSGDQIGRGRSGWVVLNTGDTNTQKDTAIKAFLQP